MLAPAPTEGGQRNVLFDLIPFALIIGIFYFLLIAPARKQRKKTQEMLESLKTGDKVVTSGGIHGTIVGITDDVVKLRIASTVQIDVSRSAVVDKFEE